MSFAEAYQRLEQVVVPPWVPISEAVRRLERAGTGALLLCEEDRTLAGLLTDGDVRRAILHEIAFSEPCRIIANAKPVVAPPTVSAVDALQLMDTTRDFVFNQLPLVDERGKAVGLLLRSDLVTQDPLALSAVIMAGGFGTRLLPLTETTPKPMLPVGDRPLLERTVESMRRAGIQQVVISTHHLADRITSHLGDGKAHGVAITYAPEDRPLGTAGALRLLPEQEQPMVVINGDILTTVRFQDVLAFHREHGAEITVGVRRCEIEIPYGVVETAGPMVRGLCEKPRQSFLINAGIYIVEPSARHEIPEGQRFDMTDLIGRLVAQGRRVACFPVVEYWLDIGRHADYQQAQLDIKTVATS